MYIDKKLDILRKRIAVPSKPSSYWTHRIVDRPVHFGTTIKHPDAGVRMMAEI